MLFNRYSDRSRDHGQYEMLLHIDIGGASVTLKKQKQQLIHDWSD